MSERLEEIKEKALKNPLSQNEKWWLIKRVEELEESNIRMHKHQHELRKDAKEWYNIASQFHDENQRFRQALDFYADEKNYKVTGEKTYIGHGDFTEETWIEVDRDGGRKAREVLGRNRNE